MSFLLRAFFEWWFPLPGKELIFARIKHTNFISGMQEAQCESITEPLIGDLVVTYAFDRDLAFTFLRPDDLERLSLVQQDLRGIAAANLKKLIPLGVDIEESFETPGLFRVVTGGDMESTIILMDEIWNDFTVKYSSDIIVSVPRRDLVLFTRRGATSAINEMKQISQAVMNETDRHNLTDTLFLWSTSGEGKWQIYEEDGTC